MRRCARAIGWMVLACALLLLAGAVNADPVRIAVAANFAGVAQELGRRFAADTGHVPTFVFGSTGKHYAQIVNGAPFDMFLAADAERPRLLEQQRLIVAGTRFTYAVGHIVLWSAREDYVDDAGAILADGTFRRLAVAEPDLAPYGRAARQALTALGHWQRLVPRIVRGKNVSQAFGFVSTGNAELGIVAASQVAAREGDSPGSVWVIPLDLYEPIEQQAVLLRDGRAGRSFIAFLHSAAARALIRAHGYESS